MPDESQGWREVLARRGPALVLFARQWRRRIADAEDAVQDGFVRFWKARERSRDDLAYLYACVRAAAIDAARADAARKRRDASAEVEQESIFVPQDDELAAQVEAALSQLPDEQREVVVMKIWGGVTFAEIAEALDISPNTAASRYRYAIEKLESELAQFCPNLRRSAP